MTAAEVETIGVVPAPQLNTTRTTTSSGMDKYAAEKQKRLARGLGLQQYIDLSKSDNFKALLEDPWVENGTPVNQVVPDGGHRRALIAGAGVSGIMFAVHLIKVGFSVEDLIIVDPAGGFGGTWYWNRYPGLMCDVESYIYCPMLEEMDYIPQDKYSSGHELRLYFEKICSKYKLHQAAMFQSKVTKMAWNSVKGRYDVSIRQMPKGGVEKTVHVSTNYAIIGSGVLHNAKIPNLEGSGTFQGDMFHTSRWNYKVTGGSPSDPSLEKLQGKKVGIIGTGATAIQAVPHLAKWAKELVVFQRTPSAVDRRDNRKTDRTTWQQEVATKPGWQRERSFNYFAFVSNADEKPDVDLVNDGWTRMPSYSALIGSPAYNVTFENVTQHVEKMNALDYPHQEEIRQRTQQIVKDPETAKSLQAWFAGWCKRPCFHDDYLPTFNRSNVTLVDTDGMGVDRITPGGIEFNGKQYDVDVLVWSTGYLSPGIGNAATKADIHLTGKNGQTLEEQYRDGTSTLHGVMSHGFPNLFWPGPFQVGASPNFSFFLEEAAKHVAFIISEASKRTGEAAVIEASTEAEEMWGAQILAGAATFASIAGCTPGYLNKEGEGSEAPMEEKMKAAKSSPWARGITDYIHVIEAWRAEAKLEGINVTAVS